MKKILILMYHMISKTDQVSEKKYAVPLSRFKRQMSYLKSKGYTAINLDSVYNYFISKDCKLPGKPVVLTFDDGYIDHYENALPVLIEHNFPATFFVVAGYVGRTNKWRIFRDCPEKRLIGGYKTACATLAGFNTEKDNIFKLKRIDVHVSDTLLQFAFKLALE